MINMQETKTKIIYSEVDIKEINIVTSRPKDFIRALDALILRFEKVAGDSSYNAQIKKEVVKQR